MPRKNRLKSPDREDVLRIHIRTLLSANEVTPQMIMDLLFIGHLIWKQGIGIPVCHIETLVDEEVKNFNLEINHLDSELNQLTNE
jgi:hypothetical protein